MNLQGLRIERVETTVRGDDFGLLGFLHAIGFQPGARLGFVKRLPAWRPGAGPLTVGIE